MKYNTIAHEQVLSKYFSHISIFTALLSQLILFVSTSYAATCGQVYASNVCGPDISTKAQSAYNACATCGGDRIEFIPLETSGSTSCVDIRCLGEPPSSSSSSSSVSDPGTRNGDAGFYGGIYYEEIEPKACGTFLTTRCSSNPNVFEFTSNDISACGLCGVVSSNQQSTIDSEGNPQYCMTVSCGTNADFSGPYWQPSMSTGGNLPPQIHFTNVSQLQSIQQGQTQSIALSVEQSANATFIDNHQSISRLELFAGFAGNNSVAQLDLTSIGVKYNISTGSHLFNFAPSEAGSYYLVARATDSAGATSEAIYLVHVASSENIPTPEGTQTAVNWSRYQVIFGNIDEDNAGLTDIYFHGLPLTLLLHGDVITPIIIEGEPGFIYYGRADGSFDGPSEMDVEPNLVKAKLSDGTWQSAADAELNTGKFNSDGFDDLLIKNPNLGASSLIISGSQGDQLPLALLEITSSGYTRVPGGPLSTERFFSSNLHSSDTALGTDGLTVDGLFSTRESLIQGLTNEGTSQSKNENISEPNLSSLPAPSLSSAQQAELDSFTTVAGNFNVNEMGAAIYQLPIALPAGTAGVKPNISLNYSSQNGDGFLGLGWALSGISSIQRCRQTPQVDGDAVPITFSQSDRFCLDGQRLLVVSGAYGANGSQYRTEIDSGLLITLNSSRINGEDVPDYFIAQGKDGATSQFGAPGIHSSEQKGFDGSNQNQYKVLTWGLHQFEDNVGNAILYDYENSPTAYHINSISYGFGNGSAAVEIHFEYQKTRSYARPVWVNGYRFFDNSLLTAISVTNEGENVGRYAFEYDGLSTEGKIDPLHRITTIDFCIDGHCARPLKLRWGQLWAGDLAEKIPENVFAVYTRSISSNSQYDRKGGSASSFRAFIIGDNRSTFTANLGIYPHAFIPLDIDGDGGQEIIAIGSHSTTGTLSLQSLDPNIGFALSDNYAVRNILELAGSADARLGKDQLRVIPADFNADGRSDLAVYIPSTNEWKTFIATPDLDTVQQGNTTSNWNWNLKLVNDLFPSNISADAQLTDINADGLIDLTFTTGSGNSSQLQSYLLKRNPAKSDSSNRAYHFVAAATINAPQFDLHKFLGALDLNQDGKAEMAALRIDLQESTTTPSAIIDHFGSVDHHCQRSYSADIYDPLNGQPKSIFLAQYTDTVTNQSSTLSAAEKVKILACNKSDSRAKIAGPYLLDINNDGLEDVVWSYLIPDYEYQYPNPILDNLSSTRPKLSLAAISYRLRTSGNALNFGNTQTLSIPNADSKVYQGFMPIDYERDGDTDLVIVGKENRHFLLENIDGQYDVGTLTEVINRYTHVNSQFFDINADGVIDRIDVEGATVHFGLGPQNADAFITEFVTPLGARTKVHYRPLRNSGRYARSAPRINTIKKCPPDSTRYDGDGEIVACISSMGSSAWYYEIDQDSFYQFVNNPLANVADNYVYIDKTIPTLELISSIPIVANVTTSSPSYEASHAVSQLDYYYESLRAQAGGRGVLGFQSIAIVDGNTGIRTENTYRQDWPYLGTLQSSVTTTADGQVLNASQINMGMKYLKSLSANDGISSQTYKPSTASANTILSTPSTEQDSTSLTTLRNTVVSGGSGALGPIALYEKTSKQSTFDLVSQANIAEVTTTSDIDSWGNIVGMQVTSSGMNGKGSFVLLQTQTTVNEYFDGSSLEPQARQFSRLSKSTVTTARNSQSITKQAQFEYAGFNGSCSAPWGQLCTESAQVLAFSEASPYQNSQAPVETSHFYDQFGNITHTQSGSRLSDFTQYDAKGRYPVATYGIFDSRVQAANDAPSGYTPIEGKVVKTSEVISRSKFGTPLMTRKTVGNGAYSYSVAAETPLGQVYFNGSSDGSSEETHRRWFASQQAVPEYCPATTQSLIEIQSNSGSLGGKCLDFLGRTVGSYKQLMDGTFSVTEQRYNQRGQLVQTSEPAKVGEPRYFTVTEYDLLGRPSLITHPFYITDANGNAGTSPQFATTRADYDGFAVTTTSSGVIGKDDRVKHEVKNALGELIEVYEQYQLTGMRRIAYEYNVLGNLTATKTPRENTQDGHVVTMTYNGLGQKTTMTDPDKGNWQYHYNAYGQLTEQRDGKDQITTLIYDATGRKTSSHTSAAEGSKAVHQTWTYDIAPFGLGQVAEEQNLSENYSQQFAYDALGRPSTTITSLPGLNGQQERFYQKQTYDHLGRPSQTFDAARVGAHFTYHGVQNDYNTFGYLYRVKDAASNGANFYTVEAMDARGNVTQMLYGDGNHIAHTYEPRTGQLSTIRRWGAMNEQQQEYQAQWDHLGNLTNRRDDLSGDIAETFTYDEHNRLKTYTLGSNASQTMVYDLADNIRQKDGLQYRYDNNNHAVSQVGNRVFDYDRNGNVISESVNATVKKRFVYTATDQVSKITANGHTSEFWYGTAGRFKRVDTDSSGNQITTLYVGAIEKVYHSSESSPGLGDKVQYKRTIAGIAQVIHNTEANGQLKAGQRHFLYKDHLGSIIAISESNGVIPEHQRFAYNPWGERRQLSNGQVTNASLSQSTLIAHFSKAARPITHRGFTGHEMLDEVGIIHMNGRIYDATIGRFLQADPHVDGATHVAGFNRYAYVKNNPLNAVDPTGYFLKKLLRAIGSNALLSTVISVVLNFIPGCQMWCSAVFNAAVNYAVTGDIGSAAFAFASGVMPLGGFTATAIIARGMMGGAFSAVRGGKFGHGFISSAAAGAKLGNDAIAQVVSAAIIGGSVSKMTGGKFANGAATAAFAAVAAVVEVGEKRRSPHVISEDVDGDYGYKDSDFVDKAIDSLRDNIRRDADGNLVLEASVSVEKGQEHLRELFLNEVNGVHKGGQKRFLWWSDGREDTLIVDLSLHVGTGEGDIHIVSRETMNTRSPEAIAWAEENPDACKYACAATEKTWIGINNTGMSSRKYLHELFHTYGLRHRRGGLMQKTAGKLKAVDILRLEELYGS